MGEVQKNVYELAQERLHIIFTSNPQLRAYMIQKRK